MATRYYSVSTVQCTLLKLYFLHRNTDPLLKDIYPVFQSVMFWFANCLEIYNFLLTQDSLNLVMPVPGEETEEESALTLLENMIQQLFQQIFYPVSKVRTTSYNISYSSDLSLSLFLSRLCIGFFPQCLKKLYTMKSTIIPLSDWLWNV